MLNEMIKGDQTREFALVAKDSVTHWQTQNIQDAQPRTGKTLN